MTAKSTYRSKYWKITSSTFFFSGLIYYDFSLPSSPSHSPSVSLEAVFTRSPTTQPVTATKTVYKYRSSPLQGRNLTASTQESEIKDGHIVVWTNPGEDVTVEDYVVFHVRTRAMPAGFTSLVSCLSRMTRAWILNSSYIFFFKKKQYYHLLRTVNQYLIN